MLIVCVIMALGRRRTRISAAAVAAALEERVVEEVVEEAESDIEDQPRDASAARTGACFASMHCFDAKNQSCRGSAHRNLALHLATAREIGGYVRLRSVTFDYSH
jgi:hypothetical protein